MGHLTLMSEDIISTLSEYGPALRIVLSQTAPVPEWEEYVNGRFTETKQKDTSLLGGGKPVVSSNPMRMGAQGFIDEADASTPSTLASDGGETSGEFRRAKSSRPTRESSADFGPAPIPEDDEDENEGPPQVSLE
jgi:serine/threonine-protein phosphatase 6 regulatory subunit 3